MRTKHWIFGPGTAGSPTGDAGLAALRIGAGLLLIFLHGMGKMPPQEGFVGWIGAMGFPAPALFAWLAGLAEFVGGLLIAIGLLTRPAAVFVFIHFVIVVFVAHAGDAIGDRELAILFGIIALAFALTGPGRYSVDALIASRTARRAGTVDR
jgi:putative oxidoreductase